MEDLECFVGADTGQHDGGGGNRRLFQGAVAAVVPPYAAAALDGHELVGAGGFLANPGHHISLVGCCFNVEIENGGEVELNC